MKLIATLIASAFAVAAFAAEPAKKEVAPVATAPAKDGKVPAKSDKPSTQKDTKAEATKK